MKKQIKAEIKESIKVKQLVSQKLTDKIETAAKLMIDALADGNKILFMGNGGSAADAQHLAAELIGRYKKERKSYAAIALSTDSSILTCLANDYSFDSVFARQIEGLAKYGDIVFGISTSGNSKNVLNAFKQAKKVGCKTIALLGCDGGKIKKESDLAIVIPSKDTPRIQESHITIGHILCNLIEQELSSR